LSSRRIGTPLYCSPERLRGAAATAADDVWSLSVVVYELLAGQHPWRRKDKSIAPGQLPDLGLCRSDCPSDVARFLARTLAPRPADRPASASDLRSGLVTLLRERPTARAASA
jgi:serine/threonine-protein kinase